VIELNTGNRDVGHFGSTSDELSLGPPAIREVDEPVLSDELRAALEEALEDIDLDDWLGTPD